MNAALSFESFHATYRDTVLAAARRLVKNETDAEDIAQEVFLKAYLHFREIHSSPRAGGWLRTVTRHLCLNYLTRYRARWRFFSELSPEGPIEDLLTDGLAAPNTPEPGAGIERQQLDQVLRTLPRGQQLLLALFHFQGLSYNEIARHLRISLAQVKNGIFRGRKTLRGRLRSEAEMFA